MAARLTHSMGILQIFLVLSQVARLGVPFAVLLFAEYGGSIMPYFALRFVDSAFGTASVSSAAVADVVSPANRAAAFGILFATFMIGYCISAGIAPFMSRYHALQVSCVLFILRVIWAVFLLPETLPPSKRAKKSSRRIENPIRAMAILWRSQLFIRLTCLIALTSFVTNGLYQIQLFYLNTVVSFNEKDTSRIMLLGGVLGILAQIFLLKPLMDCFKEKGVIVIALLSSITQCVGFTISAYYPEKWLLFAFAVPGTLGDFAFAAIASLKSINVSEKEQGRLQGAIYGARAVFEATGPVVYAAIYSRMKAHSPFSCAIPFILSGVLYVISIGVALSLPVPAHSEIKQPPLMSPTVIATPSSSSMFFSTDDEGDSETDAPVSFDRETDEVLAEPLLGPSSSSTYADV
ncbi:Major facilitator superfamily, partial [Globisporangium splendens]